MMDGIVELDIDPKIPPMLYISSDKMTLRQDECIEFEDASSLETNTDFDDKNYIVVPKVM
jgi:Asp-tRNA(Asn)/Glu-tRNA(Gln) amidotransferase C subunit